MFRKKTEVMSVKEFMNRKEVAPEPKPIMKYVVKGAVVAGVITLHLTFGNVPSALAGAIDAAVTAKVANAFDPLIQLVQALSYPIGMVMMLGGGIFIMIGNSERGLGMIQKAGVGYILIQMLPLLMDLLVEIAKSL